jgi:hypothetical protein
MMQETDSETGTLHATTQVKNWIPKAKEHLRRLKDG